MADITKLPKWAQNRIKVLENNVEYYKGMVSQISQGSDACVSWELGRENSGGLPDRAVVTFKVDGGEIDVSLRNGRVTVRGSYGLLSLDVRPEMTNTITVGLVDTR